MASAVKEGIGVLINGPAIQIGYGTVPIGSSTWASKNHAADEHLFVRVPPSVWMTSVAYCTDTLPTE
eukprot:3878253-Pyramimonas_sp.AAC.1